MPDRKPARPRVVAQTLRRISARLGLSHPRWEREFAARHHALSRSVFTSRWATISTITATIGERSIGPSGGITRRKVRRYGSQTSYRDRFTRVNQGEYGSRIHGVKMYPRHRMTKT